MFGASRRSITVQCSCCTELVFVYALMGASRYDDCLVSSGDDSVKLLLEAPVGGQAAMVTERVPMGWSHRRWGGFVLDGGGGDKLVNARTIRNSLGDWLVQFGRSHLWAIKASMQWRLVKETHLCRTKLFEGCEFEQSDSRDESSGRSLVMMLGQKGDQESLEQSAAPMTKAWSINVRIYSTTLVLPAFFSASKIPVLHPALQFASSPVHQCINAPARLHARSLRTGQHTVPNVPCPVCSPRSLPIPPGPHYCVRLPV
jgi:hypothetical protein